MRIDSELIEDAVDAVETLDDSADRIDSADAMEAVKAAIKELVKAARDIAAAHSRLEGQRADSYWYAHILGALDNEHGYCGGSMITMQSSADSLREAEADEWGTNR